MTESNQPDLRRKPSKLPRLGMRTVKTALSVVICLLINYFFFQSDFAQYSAFAAIVCMQSTVENTVRTGVNRLAGTAIGGGTGLLLLLFSGAVFPPALYFIVVFFGVIAVIYGCTAVHMAGGATICAIVFLSVFTHSNSDSVPYTEALHRIIGTIAGVFIASLVNRTIAPPRLHDPKDVSAEQCEILYKKLSSNLSGAEHLFLYASSSKSRFLLGQDGPTITIPLPLDLNQEPSIHTVYLSCSGNITHFILANKEGFVTIPPAALPCTVYWHTR